jgi:hypothetical protein
MLRVQQGMAAVNSSRLVRNPEVGSVLQDNCVMPHADMFV